MKTAHSLIEKQKFNEIHFCLLAGNGHWYLGQNNCLGYTSMNLYTHTFIVMYIEYVDAFGCKYEIIYWSVRSVKEDI